MKIFLFVIIIILSFTRLTSQNLVPNHSFEDAWSCPESYVTYPVGKPYPEWINPNSGTPDHFHVCSEHEAGVPGNFAGHLYPFDGAAYAGIVLWEKYFNLEKGKEFDFVSREYIQTKLKVPLKRNRLYCVKLQYANAAKALYSTDALGVSFTRDKITSRNGSLIIQMPQVINKPGHIMDNYENWEELCGTYRARGNELYMTIGNFWDNSQSAFRENQRENMDSTLVYGYYYIDDVRVFEIESSFECGCHNDLSYGSDRLAEDFDPETGYNSLDLRNKNLADNSDNKLNIDKSLSGGASGSGRDSGSDSGNGTGTSDNNSGNNNDPDGIGNNMGNNNSPEGGIDKGNNDTRNTSDGNLKGNLSGNNSYSPNVLVLKESEITDKAFETAKVGDKFNLNRIFFEFNSSELLAFSYIELDRLFDILSASPDVRIEIRGHTDNIGTSQYNKSLSVKRAEAVYNYLSEKGINNTRMKYRGFGNTVPLGDNTTEEGRSLNRRVEIIIVEK